MNDQIVFINASGSRGGLLVHMKLMDKARFMEVVKRWNKTVKEKGRYYLLGIRYGYMNAEAGYKLKEMNLKEFEEVFTLEEIKELDHLLDYKKGYYPEFRKEIYMKYGRDVL